jgi:hypothetical protein
MSTADAEPTLVPTSGAQQRIITREFVVSPSLSHRQSSTRSAAAATRRYVIPQFEIPAEYVEYEQYAQPEYAEAQYETLQEDEQQYLEGAYPEEGYDVGTAEYEYSSW